MKVFTPRHMRKGNKGGAKEKEKQKAFRRCKKISDRFIHLKASQLNKPGIREDYLRYCDVCDRDGLRKSGK